MSNFTIQELEFIKSELKYRANYAPEENTEEQNILYNSIDRKIIIEQLNQTKTKMSKEELKKNFTDSLKPLLQDKEAQEDAEIVDFYMDVCCDIAEEHLNQNKDE